MNLLTVKNLNLDIHETPILREVSFSIRSGEIVGIIGESGSGKSMTAYSITQLLPQGSVTSGSVKLNGEELLNASEELMCSLRGNELGMVFQEPMTALNPVKTIGDQVAETVLIHGKASRADAMQIARQTLDRVELPEDEFPMSRYPHELSGGQRQRVVIAMAIALQPKLLIADEPTTALDVTTQAEVLELLLRLVREDNMGLILITHDLAVVANLANQIVIMKSGKVVEQGPANSIFKEMKHPYTKALLEASSHTPERSDADEPAVEPLLRVDKVIRDYRTPRKGFFGVPGTFRAVDGVSFEIMPGESVGLVGESGCGKSTLTRAILGLEPLQGGSIRLSGEPVLAASGVDRKTRQKMQVVFQDPYGSFNPRHKVGRLISEPMFLLDVQPSVGERMDRVAEVLESVGLRPADTDKYIHEFSGGQRQRIAIARALIIKPELIILDEAVSALDVSIRAQILDLLADLSDKYGLAYFFISHDLSVVRSITDRVLVMKNGKIVEQGETEQVFEEPQHLYTQSLIQAVPRLPVHQA